MPDLHHRAQNSNVPPTQKRGARQDARSRQNIRNLVFTKLCFQAAFWVFFIPKRQPERVLHQLKMRILQIQTRA